MPKIKTHRGAAKRFKKSGTGKLQRHHAFKSHILTKKGPGRKASLAAETEESLQSPSGLRGRPTTRGELHIYNLRHVQHHVGQLSAFLRRVDPTLNDSKGPPWIGTGWR